MSEKVPTIREIKKITIELLPKERFTMYFNDLKEEVQMEVPEDNLRHAARALTRACTKAWNFFDTAETTIITNKQNKEVETEESTKGQKSEKFTADDIRAIVKSIEEVLGDDLLIEFYKDPTTFYQEVLDKFNKFKDEK